MMGRQELIVNVVPTFVFSALLQRGEKTTIFAWKVHRLNRHLETFLPGYSKIHDNILSIYLSIYQERRK